MVDVLRREILRTIDEIRRARSSANVGREAQLRNALQTLHQRYRQAQLLARRDQREFEATLTAASTEAELAQVGEAMARRPSTPEEVAARQRGAQLVRYWIGELDKSNPSGTPVRPQAQIKAGNQLIQEANLMPNHNPLKVPYRHHGRYLMAKGRQGLHKSQRGGGAGRGRGGARESEAMFRPTVYTGRQRGSGQRDPILAGLMYAGSNMIAASNLAASTDVRRALPYIERALSHLRGVLQRVVNTPWRRAAVAALSHLNVARQSTGNPALVGRYIDAARRAVQTAMTYRRRELGR